MAPKSFPPPYIPFQSKYVERGGDGRAQGRGAGKEEQVCGANNEEQG
jgi:hypothetical protein